MNVVELRNIISVLNDLADSVESGSMTYKSGSIKAEIHRDYTDKEYLLGHIEKVSPNSVTVSVKSNLTVDLDSLNRSNYSKG